MVGDIDGPDGDSSRRGGWRKIARILVLVTSADHHGQTCLDGSTNSLVESFRLGTSQRHIRDLSTSISATHILAYQERGSLIS